LTEVVVAVLGGSDPINSGIVSEVDPQAVSLRLTRPGDAEEARGVQFLHAHEDCLLMAFPNLTLGLDPNVP
jgi:hypothetical protein